MLRYSDIFNTKTLNIFTDASITKIDAFNPVETIGCSGAVLVHTYDGGDTKIIDETYFINRQSTNNDSEIKAIHAGVIRALDYVSQYENINLFSDSRICIQGLREWIFNWIHCIQNGIMYGSSGPVMNQQIILSIVNTIISKNLNIRLYHQKGHVTQSILEKARNVFCQTNNLKDVDMSLIMAISDYNNYVDNRSRNILEVQTANMSQINLQQSPILFTHSIDENKYKKLLGRK